MRHGTTSEQGLSLDPTSPMSGNAPAGTGRPDLLLMAAVQAKDDGFPFAPQVEQLVVDSTTEAEGDIAAWYATRPLKDHEQTPVAVVLGAVHAALDAGDPALVDQTIEEGLALMARWPAYLAGSATGHPELALESSTEAPPS